MTVDIAEPEHAEETLRRSERLRLAKEDRGKLSGRLIEAQEAERARIARELHDDICQQLALLAMQLDQMRLKTPVLSNGQPERRRFEADRLAQLQHAVDTCREIGKNVQALSYDIHSSKLDYLGLVSAVRSLCGESSERSRVKVVFTSEDIPGALTREVSLCIFRIAQEALRNGIKHSGATCFYVSLRGERDGIALRVFDQGVGFDPKVVREEFGLGLVSIQERVDLLNGTFSIESKPNQGTTIKAWIPVLPTALEMAAAARYL